MQSVSQGFYKQIAAEIMLLIAMGLILGALGPFGTYVMPTGIRLLYWVSFGLVGYCFFRPVTFVADWLAAASPLPVWLCIAIATASASFPVTFLVGIALYGADHIGSAQFNSYFPILYCQVAGIGIGIFLLMRLLFHVNDPADNRPEAPPSAATPPPYAPTSTPPPASTPAAAAKSPPTNDMPQLYKRLPVGFPPQIIALGVEDHYVRVFAVHGDMEQDTALHSEMLLMRLKDAIDEMPPAQGAQVHRSWWVARAAIADIKRDGRNMELQLKGHLNVPVSRTYKARLKALGWF